MKKSFLIVTFIMAISAVSYAQKNNLNSYKYILVPAQYEFQKSEDAYQVNSLTKFLFNRAGFTVFMTNETIPAELANNSCMALKAMVVNNSGMLRTKMQLKLVDCYNNVVYLTEEGNSKEKEYQKAYHEAIREAFEEIEALNYEYNKPQIETKQEVKVVETALPKPIVKEVVEAVDDIQKVVVVEEKIETTQAIKVVAPIIEKKKTITKPIQEEIKEIEIKPVVAIEGTYEVEKWGSCKILKTDEGYAFTAGDENFEFAVVYPTSKPTIFIIKYAAYKQPQMLELSADGSLKVDSATGIKTYKRVR
ncbi:hypothetical protein [Lutibacter sp.]|uniref:hypothetical protein n=1 Tax=Lutibacter sp. TaxID=1925666 RepID=UPI001A302F99|nr:hypothetical protein [Lutibacter sp.]MBI9040611.1 hypothetical protein [Lutibacter sp.]